MKPPGTALDHQILPAARNFKWANSVTGLTNNAGDNKEDSRLATEKKGDKKEGAAAFMQIRAIP